MKGVRVDVHQSSSRNDNRKLLSMTRSPSVAVVDEMAPRWITTSSLRPFSQSDKSDEGTKSASWRFCRLRHLPSDPSVSLTTTSVCPASFRSATTFDPMNPAPPVTSNIRGSFSAMKLTPMLSLPSLTLAEPDVQEDVLAFVAFFCTIPKHRATSRTWYEGLK